MASKSTEETSARRICGRTTSFQTFNFLLRSVTFPYNSLYTQAYVESNFELGKPVNEHHVI